VYAPEGFKKDLLLAKIEDDFGGAVDHWSDLFDEWVFVHNSTAGLPPYATSDLENRSAEDGRITCTQWGYAKLRKLTFELDDHSLYELLGPPVSQVDMLEVEISDVIPLLRAIELAPMQPLHVVGNVPADKLFINGLSEDAEHLLLHGLRRAAEVSKYFDAQTQRPMMRDDLGHRFTAKYLDLRESGLEPDSILNALCEWLTGPSPATKTNAAALAVLAFFFEECDIFESTSVPS
jgi:hypothetical protein